MNRVTLYLLRHGEPADLELFYGQLDVALSRCGEQQIEAQVEAFRGSSIDAVLASDLSRARRGGQALADALGVPLTVDDALREMHLGVLEGVSHDDGRTRHPELATRPYRDMFDFRMPGGGESVEDVAGRVLPPIERAVTEAALRGSTGVIVYSHNTINRLVLGVAAGAGARAFPRFFQNYGAINRIDVDITAIAHLSREQVWERATIRFSNRDPHLIDRTRDIV